jgi:preprotein translocase subunit SecD
MGRVRRWRVGVILLVLLLATIFILPSIPSFYATWYGHLDRELQGVVRTPIKVEGGLEFDLSGYTGKAGDALSKAYRRLAAGLRERARAVGLQDVAINGATSPLEDARNIQSRLLFSYKDVKGRSPDTVLAALQLYGKLPLGLRGWLFPDKRVELGLDLKGGVYLALGLDMEEAERQLLAEAQQNIKRDLRERYRVNCRDVRLEGNGLVAVIKVNPQEWGKPGDTRKTDTEAYLRGLEHFDVAPRNDGRPNAEELVEYRLTPSGGRQSVRTEQALTQVLEVLRNRVDAFGVAEPDIRREPGKPRIIVQLPGASDSSTAANVVRTMGRLDFRLVQQHEGQHWLGEGTPPPREELPPDTEVLFDREGHWLVVERAPVVTGGDIIRAMATQQNFEIVVALRFNAAGRRAFGEATDKHVGELLAIVLDNTVQSYPVIREPILGGEATISGKYTQDEADELARVLQAGAFPVGVKIEYERTVGPSLGREAIQKSVRATALGIVAIFLFMGFYYSLFGVFAVVALLLNGVLTLAALAALGATLTLPGVAGLALSLGMAVDANVLINERIKEELRSGKTVASAIVAGYSRVFWTIFDSNLTTMLAALVLIQFGTGTIRGFGVTLTIGIVASMFTALFVTREMARPLGERKKALPIYPLFGFRKA